MGRRHRLISSSILRAIFRSEPAPDDEEARPGLIARIVAFFAIFSLALVRYRARLFKKLRIENWEIEEEEYKESFRSPSKNKRTDLVAAGDLGYSGSTFFTTPNSKFLIKSLPRAFEQDFFRDTLLERYVGHMQMYKDSLLVRITDLLHCPYTTLGSALGAAPNHHVIMENILYGKSACAKHDQDSWETYDLKPNDFFFPERDVAGGMLAPQSVKDRLIDAFPSKICVTVDQKEELVAQLSEDSKLLQNANAVDYSLFVIRYPVELLDHVPTPPGRGSWWRSGIPSRDGWVYRITVIDFFWARDSFQAHSLSALVKLFNALKWGKDHGDMSVTSSSDEYRRRFLAMVDELVEVPDSAGRPSGEVRSPVSGNAET
ncbi:hypothetical protein ACEQ8H_006108 [Pleosporales sp. CAS-2024a]